MTPALVKLLLTPSFIALTTLLARRWGPGAGGTIAGLPLTSAPVSVFLALEQGPAFAAAAAGGTLLGLLSQAALCLTYSAMARRAGWWTSASAGVAAFLAVTLALRPISLPVWLAFALVSALLVLTAVAIPGTAAASRPAPPPRWDVPARMVVATVMVLGLTAIASRIGPIWTGLLSPFPVFALVLGAFTHRAEGPAEAALLLRGVVLGSLAHGAMFALVASLLVPYGLVRAYAWSALAALGTSALALAWARSRPVSRPQPRSTA
jgi:hypothetical protein